MCEFVREIKSRKIQSCLPFFSSLPFFSPPLPLSVNGGSKKRKEEITFDFPLIVEERVEGNARGRYVPLVRKKDTRNIINCGGCDRSRVLFYSRYTSSFHTYVYLFLILFFFLPPSPFSPFYPTPRDTGRINERDSWLDGGSFTGFQFVY